MLKNAKIMIIDDVVANVKLLEKLLSIDGYQEIVVSNSSQEGYELIKNGGFDIVLLDLEMPLLDGFEVMEMMRKEMEKIPPVLVLTANQDVVSKHKALSICARDYLVKPFDQLEVLLRVSNLLKVHYYEKEIENQNKILEQKVEERTREIQETQLEILHKLGLAAEYKDNETGLHTMRMSRYSKVIAAALNYSQEECDLIFHASPMHDIGKIGIPDNVLLKPGKLDKEEWSVMQNHAKIGADILQNSNSKLLIVAHKIALTHHEKWDGSGYPNNLVGEDIPLCGRIVAVADVFDALTSVRPYKKAWTNEEAFKLLKDSKGSHFDPKVVDAFFSKIDKILEIQRKYQES